MYPLIYIVLRQSPDWAAQTYDDLEKTREFCLMVGRPETFIIDRVRLWDRTFGIGFFAARQAMKEISLENFKAISGSKLIPIAEVRDVLKPEAFYLFTDDDDWYSPGIAETLRRLDPKKCDAVLWGSGVFGGGITLRMDGVFWTNSYAVSGTFLKQRRKNLDRVSQHFGAQGTFVGSRRSALRRLGYRSVMRRFFVPGYGPVAKIDSYLSVTNKHPASTVVLESLGDRAMPENLHAMIREAIEADKAVNPPPQFAWAGPYMAQVIDFYSRLLASAR